VVGEVSPFTGRIYSLAEPWTAAEAGRYDLLPANLPALHGLASIGLYAALGDPTFADLVDPLGAVNLAFGASQPSAVAVATQRQLLDLLGVQMVLSPQPLASFEGEEHIGSTYLYRNPGAFPRAWVAGEVRPLQGDLRTALESTDLRKVALIDRPEAIPFLDVPPDSVRLASSGSATIVQDSGNRIDIAAAGPGVLVLDDRWAPGWTATVDAASTPVLRVDGILRGVPLALGAHVVTFAYRPAGFWLGIPVTALAAIVLLGIAVERSVRHLLARANPRSG
jgi:hypothetical protein